MLRPIDDASVGCMSPVVEDLSLLRPSADGQLTEGQISTQNLVSDRLAPIYNRKSASLRQDDHWLRTSTSERVIDTREY